MSQETYDRVQASFGPNAHEYTISQGHANSAELNRLVARIGPSSTDRLLDIGTGAGHTALAFAPSVAQVVAFDLTPQMLEEVARNAEARGLTNISTQEGAAETLPYPDASFELVTCRLTTHHFADLPQAVREMARVLTTGGRLIIQDTSVPEDDRLDQEINEIEVLRDPSHVRNYRASQWRQMLTAVGLTVVDEEAGYYDEGDKMDFDQWTRRIKTSPANVARLQQLFRQADSALVAALKIELDGPAIGFALPRITIVARK